MCLSFGCAAFGQSTPTSLQVLIEEAGQNNAAIKAAERAIQTSEYMPKQASALPDTEVMVQSFTVGSPRPFAGYSNSDFAYIGFGASQELPYPGKRALRGNVAQHGIAISRAEKDAVAWDVLTRLKLAYFQLAASQQLFPCSNKISKCGRDRASCRDPLSRGTGHAAGCASNPT